VLRAPALLHVRALRSRYPRAPLLCIPCLVRRHHGSLRLMPHADHSPCGSCTSGSPSCASPTRDTALSTSSLVAARRLAAQGPCARMVACTRGLPRSPHASGQQDSMYACVSLCLCAPSTAVRTSKRHSVTFCGTQQHKRQPLRQIPYSSACTCRYIELKPMLKPHPRGCGGAGSVPCEKSTDQHGGACTLAADEEVNFLSDRCGTAQQKGSLVL
jgi:hypothetical protein